MSDTVETIEYRGYEIEIYGDDSPESPREWDNLGEIVGYCESYELYDVKNPYSGLGGSHIGDFKMYLESIDLKLKDVIYLPVSAYIHGGVSLSIGSLSGFDSGQVGYIYVTKETVKKEYSRKRVSKKMNYRIEKYLTNEIELFSQYCNGEVYGFEIVKDDEIIDTLSGFYGYEHKTSGLLSEAEGYIDLDIECKRIAKQNKTKVMIKNNVPLAVR